MFKLTLVLISVVYYCAASNSKPGNEFGKSRTAPRNVTRSEFKFPPNFLFGVATSAYQVEGAWNEGGKGESIWDYQVHHHPERIANRSTGDVACDSYHHIDEDIRMLMKLKVNFYKFSLSWTRLLPYGNTNESSADGIDFYKELIDKLLENDIIPVVTLYHWDLPQRFQELGGWTNELMIQSIRRSSEALDNFQRAIWDCSAFLWWWFVGTVYTSRR